VTSECSSKGELVKNDPPNAVLAFLEPGDDMAEDVVIEDRKAGPPCCSRERGQSFA